MDTKAALRTQVRQRRAARPDDERDRAAERLAAVVTAVPAVRAARRVACYRSRPAEPGTGPLLRALHAAGAVVLLPVVTGPGRPLDWAVDDGADVPGPLGLSQPAGPRLGPRAVAGCDVLVVPALAVDRSGARLGQGGGYYDRTLARLGPGRPPVVALVHDDELLAAGEVPAGPHDVPVDAAATPSGWVPLAGWAARATARRPGAAG